MRHAYDLYFNNYKRYGELVEALKIPSEFVKPIRKKLTTTA